MSTIVKSISFLFGLIFIGLFIEVNAQSPKQNPIRLKIMRGKVLPTINNSVFRSGPFFGQRLVHGKEYDLLTNPPTPKYDYIFTANNQGYITEFIVMMATTQDTIFKESTIYFSDSVPIKIITKFSDTSFFSTDAISEKSYNPLSGKIISDVSYRGNGRFYSARHWKRSSTLDSIIFVVDQSTMPNDPPNIDTNSIRIRYKNSSGQIILDSSVLNGPGDCRYSYSIDGSLSKIYRFANPSFKDTTNVFSLVDTIGFRRNRTTQFRYPKGDLLSDLDNFSEPFYFVNYSLDIRKPFEADVAGYSSEESYLIFRATSIYDTINSKREIYHRTNRINGQLQSIIFISRSRDDTNGIVQNWKYDQIDSVAFSLTTSRIVKNFSNPSWYLKPHPVNENFQLGGLTSPATIHIYNSLGQLLIQQNIEPDQVIFTSHLMPGIYQLKIQSGDQLRHLQLLKE